MSFVGLGMIGPNMMGGMVDETITYTVEFMGTLEWASDDTISGNIDIGAADAEREVFLVAVVESTTGTNRVLQAAITTINGVVVTKATNEFESNLDSDLTLTCAFASVPSGSGSVAILMEYNGPLQDGIVGVYRVVGRPGIGTNQDDFSSNEATSTTVALNATTINAGGFWLGLMTVNTTGRVITPPTDTTEDFEGDAAALNHVTFNSRQVQQTASTPTDTWTCNVSDSLVAASWSFD